MRKNKMYSIQEFDETKAKVMKYIVYKKRSEYEVRNRFSQTIEENMLEDIIIYLKQAGYIDDFKYIKKIVNEFILLKNLSITEIKYKLYAKGIHNSLIEDYIQSNMYDLYEYEKKSIENIMAKKSRDMKIEEVKSYLLKKGYKSDNIKDVIEKR